MQNRYRIAMVGACPFPTSQGSQVLIRQLSESLAARGHKVHIVAYHLGETKPHSENYLIHRIPSVPGYNKISSGPAWGKIILDFLLIWVLLKVVYQEKIEVIHAHNYEALFVGWIVRMLTGRPLVYHSHNVMASELPTYFRHPLFANLAKRLARLLDRNLLKKADTCIALSSEAVDYFHLNGVDEERISLIPPGIDFEPIPRTSKSDIRTAYQLSSTPLAIYTGNLDQYQRLGFLLRSFELVRRSLPQAQLVIASHSPASQFARLVQRVGDVQGVRFIHTRDFGETRHLLSVADVAICPRIACYGFPIKLLNYMAAGKAIVVAQGSAKGINNLENGLIVADREEEMARGVIRLLGDEGLAHKLGEEARKTVQGRFQWSHVIREIERLYVKTTCADPESILKPGEL